jgi:hypothetical protein
MEDGVTEADDLGTIGQIFTWHINSPWPLFGLTIGLLIAT